jgi:hypothetical protein
MIHDIMNEKIIPESIICSADAVTTQDLGDEVLLYDAGRENVHILNTTAQAIWKLCDGRHTVGQICEKIIREYPYMSSSEITDDVTGILAELYAKNLITIV